MKAMICRNCGAGLEAERIDTTLGVVTCSHCGSLHDIPARLLKGSEDEAAHAPRKKPERVEVALPDQFKVKKNAGSMEVIWPAGGIMHGVVLSIIAGVFAYVAITSGMLFLIAASAGLFYFAAVKGFNKNCIRIDKSRLEVTHGPLPSPGSRKLNASDIVQLYATEHKTKTQTQNNPHHHDNRTNVRKHYKLSAKTRHNGNVKIISGLHDPLQALWLEQEIERLLGIEDESVSGEHIP